MRARGPSLRAPARSGAIIQAVVFSRRAARSGAIIQAAVFPGARRDSGANHGL